MVKTLSFDCQQCGASLDFSPGQHAMVCHRCDFEQPLPLTIDPEIRGTPLEEAPTRSVVESVAGELVHCGGCGATLSGAYRANRCSFCDSPVIVEGSNSVLQPDAVLPFHIERGQAESTLRKWLASHRFAPSGFRSGSKLGSLSGIYVPYFVFACESSTRYDGERGTVYYETESYTDSEGQRQTRQVRKVSWERVSGQVERPFDHRLVCASPTLPRIIADRLEPWDLAFLQKFRPEILSGFVCEHGALAAREGFAKLRDALESDVRTDVRFDIGGDEQRITTMSVRFYEESYRLVLLPVWLTSYPFGDERTPVAINARTGEVVAARRAPWSWLRIAGFATAALVLLVGPIVALTYLFQ